MRPFWQRATAEALKVGYRLIDTAFVYGGEKTEAEVGKALRSSSVHNCGSTMLLIVLLKSCMSKCVEMVVLQLSSN